MLEALPYILLIDDDDDDGELISSSLELLGVKTKVYDSSEKAIYYLTLMSDTSDFPALIVMDYNIPRLNGQELLNLIKTNPSTRDIPIVMYSTSLPNDCRKTLMSMGAYACYVKPNSYSEFNAQVGIFRDLAFSFSTHRMIDKN